VLKIRRLIIYVLKDGIYNSPEPSCANIVFLIELDSDLSHLLYCRMSLEYDIDILSLKEFNGLEKQIVLCVGEDLYEVISCQRFHLCLNGHSSLKFDRELSWLYLFESPSPNKENISRIYFNF